VHLKKKHQIHFRVAKYIQPCLLKQSKHLKYLLVWLKAGRSVGYLAFGWAVQMAFEKVFLQEKND